MSVLTKDELALLLLVPTTPGQADVLIERNEKMVDHIDEFIEMIDQNLLYAHGVEHTARTVWVKCPHCKEAYPCGECAYRQVICRTRKPYRDRATFECCVFTFGGHVFDSDIDARDWAKISLSHQSMHLGIEPFKDEYEWRFVKEDLEDIREWLLGHIEWGEAVIAQDGVPWPEEEEHE